MLFAFSGDPAFVREFFRSCAVWRSAAMATTLTAVSVGEGAAEGRSGTVLYCSRAMAEKGIYPAVDASMSEASGLNRATVPQDFARISSEVRASVGHALANLPPGPVTNMGELAQANPAWRAALQALCFLGQPYFVAEPYTGMAGDIVPLKETLASFAAILAGRYAQVDPLEFRMKDSLPRTADS